jgi:hypothetical protein
MVAMNGGTVVEDSQTNLNVQNGQHNHKDQQHQQQNDQAPPPPPPLPPPDVVCCGCRPRRRRYRKNIDGEEDDGSSYTRSSFFRIGRRQRRDRTDSIASSDQNQSTSSSWPFPRLTVRRRYFDADMGDDSDWARAYANMTVGDDSNAADSVYFFDALEDPLGEEEYPIDAYVVKSDILGEYPIFFTTSLQHPAPHVSLDEPETMLKKKKEKAGGQVGTAGSQRQGAVSSSSSPNRSYSLDGGKAISSQSLWIATADGTESATATSSSSPTKKKLSQQQRRTQQAERRNSEPIRSHKERSVRFLDIQRRPTLEHAKELEQPRVKVSLKGYPGELEINELEECVSFVCVVFVVLFTNIVRS